MRIILVLRAAVGVVFGLRLLLGTGLGWAAMFGELADYLVIDGVLAVIIAGALMRDGVGGSKNREMAVGAIVLADGLGRTVAGISVHLLPGLPDFPVTAVIFLGIMAGCTALVGLAATAIIGTEERARHGPGRPREQFPVGPVGLAAIAAIAFGVSTLVFLTEPEMIRPLVALYMIAGGVAMLAAAWPTGTRRARAGS
jgi:hypothetical protein